jgi:hypothetical protein
MIFKTRYLEEKVNPPDLQSGDTQRVLAAMKNRHPGFGQSPPHPSEIMVRVGMEYLDRFRGDRK